MTLWTDTSQETNLCDSSCSEVKTDKYIDMTFIALEKNESNVGMRLMHITLYV